LAIMDDGTDGQFSIPQGIIIGLLIAP
jgi:hypothetical protein